MKEKNLPGYTGYRVYRFEGADDSSKTRFNLVFEHVKQRTRLVVYINTTQERKIRIVRVVP